MVDNNGGFKHGIRKKKNTTQSWQVQSSEEKNARTVTLSITTSSSTLHLKMPIVEVDFKFSSERLPYNDLVMDFWGWMMTS